MIQLSTPTRSFILTVWLLVGNLLLPASVVASPHTGLADSPSTSGTVHHNPPKTLSPDLLYAVLLGQIAAQRHAFQTAYQQLLYAARLSRDPTLAEQATRISLKRDDAEAVQQALDLWLEIAPHSMAAHQIAAYVCLQNEDIECAKQHLGQLVEAASEGGENAFMRAARLVHRLRPPEKRLKLMEALTKGEPENADAWFARALVAAGAGRQADAVAAARRAVALRPHWNEPRIFLVQLLRNLGKTEEARTALERFVQEDPEDYALRMVYAQLLVDEGAFAEARDAFEKLLERDPKEPDVLFALGILSLQLGELKPAKDYFIRLRDTGKRRNDAAYYLGQVEESEGHPDRAIEWYARVRGPQSLDAQLRIVQLEAKGHHLDRARERLHHLRDRWPEKAALLYQFEAELLAERGQDAEAMAVYDEALEVYPKNPKLLYARALHAGAMHRLDRLERDLRTLLAEEPENADALNALGYTLADQTDRYEEALALIERALALKPDDPTILDSMGWVQYRLGHLQQARDYLERALAKLRDGEIAAHLGEVLWALGDRKGAWRVWEAAKKADPDHEYLLRVMSRHHYTKTEPPSP